MEKSDILILKHTKKFTDNRKDKTMKKYRVVYEMEVVIEAENENEAKDIWYSLNLNGSEHKAVSYEYRTAIATYENQRDDDDPIYEIDNF